MGPPKHAKLEPLVGSVLHPTDFSSASVEALAHALGIALWRNTRLTLLHAGADPRSRETWAEFPSVREILAGWGLLDPDSPRSAVFDELAVRVKKVTLPGGNPLTAILGFLAGHPTDLIVLATRGTVGPNRWIRRPVAEPLAARSRTMTLFVRDGARGFVSPESGRISLRKILVPVDHAPPAAAAVEFAARMVEALADGEPEVVLLHAGSSGPMPAVELPANRRWTVRSVRRNGEPVRAILKVAQQIRADLIAMVTAGPEGILDALRGSTTQQVVRRAPCPVLAIPADHP